MAVQDPRLAARHFDLVVVASHDPLRGPKILVSDGALHRITDEKLAEARHEFAALFSELPRPLVAVSLGGNNPHYRFGRNEAAELAENLIKLAQKGCGLAITPSRRTAPESLAVLQTRLAQSLAPESYYLWDFTGKKPVFWSAGLCRSFGRDGRFRVDDFRSGRHRQTGACLFIAPSPKSAVAQTNSVIDKA